MTTFRRWLQQQAKRDDPVGDLARDTAHDPTWPRTGDKSALLDYLSGRHASRGALAALEAAWEEWARTEDAPPPYDQHRDPAWLRSSASYWAERLVQNPQDQDARSTLRQVQELARAAGVELDLPPGTPDVRPSARDRAASLVAIADLERAGLAVVWAEDLAALQRQAEGDATRDRVHDLWIDVERMQAHLAQKLVHLVATWKGELHDASLTVQDSRASVELLNGTLLELEELGEAVDRHDLWAHVELTQARLANILARLVAGWKGELHDASAAVEEARGSVELLHDLLRELEERGENVDRRRWTMEPRPRPA